MSTVAQDPAQHISEHGSTANSNGSNPDLEKRYTGGLSAQRTLTPGGHFANDDLIIAASSHRRIANPTPTAAFAFATTTLTLSLFNCGVQGIEIPEAVLVYSLFYGGLVQFLGGLWEFADGNTFGATVFTSYGCFWWGLSIFFVPWFGQLNNYSETQPGVYTAQGMGAAEGETAVGLYLFIWLGITLCLTCATIRTSVMMISLFVLLDIALVCLGAFYYTGNTKLQTAGGVFGCILAFNAYYVGAANLFTKQTSYFKLPTGSLARKD